MHWVDAAITNARSGRCMCGRTDGVEYGPHIMGYGPCCIHCQREWSRQHGGTRWESDKEKVSRLRAEKARALADGRDEGEITVAWNRGLPPFERPPQTDTSVSDQWQREYDAWAASASAPRQPAVPDTRKEPADG